MPSGTSVVQYMESLTLREIDWINTYADPTKTIESPWQYSSPEQQNPETHIKLLRRFYSAIPHIIPKNPDLFEPRFWHADFHDGNIYVDAQGHVSSIIDW
jgi:Ser/Thr protein kinase RdoA (MazF antagonist)